MGTRIFTYMNQEIVYVFILVIAVLDRFGKIYTEKAAAILNWMGFFVLDTMILFHTFIKFSIQFYYQYRLEKSFRTSARSHVFGFRLLQAVRVLVLCS